MSKKDPSSPALGPKAMEMVMRDVLGGMEDLAIMKSFDSINKVFEIISISPSETPDQCLNSIPNEGADIIPFYRQKKA